jgi:hypothetical protein
MALLFSACGGGESGPEEAVTTVTTAGSDVTTTTAATDATEPTTATTGGGDESGSDDLSGLPDMSGGSASFTLAGETEEFDWFVCFSGDAVAVLEPGQDEITFLAVGRRGGSFPSMEGVEAQIIVSQGELGLVGTQQDIFYTRIGSDGAETSWVSTVSVDEEGEAEIEGGRVTFEGEMERIVDGQASDETDPGSLEATCSPNSLGS